MLTSPPIPPRLPRVLVLVVLAVVTAGAEAPALAPVLAPALAPTVAPAALLVPVVPVVPAAGLGTADPRPALVALELANRHREALARVQEETAERPAAGRRIGLDYLRGHLLELLGRPADSVPAFVDAISATPRLAFHSRYRLAAEQIRLGHPEVAAGLLATGLAAEPSSPLAPEAVRLLVQSLARGGDCRLLRGFRTHQLATPERRQVQLAQADCDLQGVPRQATSGAAADLQGVPRQATGRAAADLQGVPRRATGGAAADLQRVPRQATSATSGAPAAPAGSAAASAAAGAAADPRASVTPQQAARSLLIALLDENHEDDVARLAADRLAALTADGERGRVPLLLSMTYFEHREFDRSVRQLAHVLGTPGAPGAPGAKSRSPSPRDLAEARYALGRADFWQGRFEAAAKTFGEVAEGAPSAAERARALLQQGRSYEMLGDWKRAVASFRLAFLAEPGGEWAAPSLLATLRLEWRTGNDATAASVLSMLGSSPQWRDSARRAALFMAASDLVRGRADRAGAWLDRAAAGGPDEDLPEVAYWRGRLAEQQRQLPAAVAAYLAALRADLYHPLSRAAAARLAVEPLAGEARTAGRRLAVSRHLHDLYDAWLLLGPADPAGQLAERRLRTQLLADPAAAPFLRMSELPIDAWPLWTATLRRPQEMLLALGVWHEGAPAVRELFPPAQPSLALTGSLLLARTGETARSIQLAEALRERVPARLPPVLLPAVFQRCLYPFAYRESLLAEGRLRGVDPYLMAALIRVESRFDAQALSPGAARGLTQFVLATARRVAAGIGMERLEPDDLYRPEVAIDLGGAYLAQLQRTFRGTPHIAIAAYDAGEAQAILWRTYCFSQEPEEYFTKVGFRETRLHLARVLAAWTQYQRLYG
jgi:soluble lytic murein transglycosylase